MRVATAASAVDISTVADFAFFLRADFDMTIPTQSSARYRPSQVKARTRRHTLVFVNVVEQQHAAKLAFVVARESAARGERVGIAIGSEQPVPEWQVGVVVVMDIELMMD